MKNIKISSFIFILSLLLFSCNDDESVNLVEPNHRVIVTSEMDFENTINVGGHIDFGDLSQGIKSRTWTFPESVSSILGEEGNTSSKETIKGFFFKPGVYNVVLNQTYKGNVYRNEDSTAPMDGRELDTTIVVTVLPNVKSNIQINYINDDGTLGEPLDLSDNAANEIIASKSVRLTQSSDGAPTDFTWNLKGANPEEVNTQSSEIDVKYTKLGTWDLEFIASRTRPKSSHTIYIKNFIKVEASTEPVTLDRVFETEAQTTIGLEFSREMNPATINKNNFSVEIETANGAILSPTITDVTQDSSEGNILKVLLADEIMYNDDTVKLTYTPGTLTTLDGVAATSITDAVLTDFIKTNMFEEDDSNVDYSFESSDVTNFPYLWWGGQWGEYDLSIPFDNPRTGDKSMYVELRPQGGMIIGNTNGGENIPENFITFPVESGFKYEIGVWVYVEDLGTPDPTVAAPDLRFYWRPSTDWSIGPNPAFPQGFTTGEWVYSSTIVQFTNTGNESFMIRGNNAGNPETLKFYMDDLAIYKLTSRP